MGDVGAITSNRSQSRTGQCRRLDRRHFLDPGTDAHYLRLASAEEERLYVLRRHRSHYEKWLRLDCEPPRKVLSCSFVGRPRQAFDRPLVRRPSPHAEPVRKVGKCSSFLFVHALLPPGLSRTPDFAPPPEVPKNILAVSPHVPDLPPILRTGQTKVDAFLQRLKSVGPRMQKNVP
jgi:hypothetical protein